MKRFCCIRYASLVSFNFFFLQAIVKVNEEITSYQLQLKYFRNFLNIIYMFVVDATVCPGNFEIASIYMETDQDIVLFQICYNFT